MLYSDLTPEEKGELASMIIQLLDSWDLNSEQQILLLSLPEKTPLRALRKYKKNTPFPENEQLVNKLTHIIGIAEALRTTYPRNAQMGRQWIHKPHKRFSDRSPLRTMLEDGLKGVVTVRAELDCAFAWKNYDM